MAIRYKFKVGETVEKRLYASDPWRPAVVERLEPYLGGPGYYVRYTDASEQWHCRGGWASEGSLRPASVV